MNSKVSVVIPTYNRGPQIEKTLDSVLSQTRLPDEILIVDDGSTDGTAAWIENHYLSEPRVRVLRQTNGGVARARNRGVEIAQGEFIAFLDHDDLWLPHHLEAQLEAFASRPNASVVFARWRNVDEDGQELPLSPLFTSNPKRLPPSGGAYQWICRTPCPIVSMSVTMIRASHLRSIGGFDAATAPADDWDLWLRMSKQFDFVQVPREEETVLYVCHSHQQSLQFRRMRRGIVATIKKHKRSALRHPARLLFLLALEAYFSTASLYGRTKQAAVDGDFGRGWRYFLLAISRAPIVLFSKQWLYLAKRLALRDPRPY